VNVTLRFGGCHLFSPSPPVFAFKPHTDRPVDEVARTDPGFLEWMIKKDFSDEAKAVAPEALARQRAQQAVPMPVE